MTPNDDGPDYVEFSHPQGHLVARVAVPSIGQAEASVIRDQIAERIGHTQNGRCFVLDLSQVSLLNSMGLGACVDLRNLAEKSGLRPILFGMNRHLDELFRLMRIDRLFKVAHTQHELDDMMGA